MYDKTKSVEENLVLVNKYVEDNQGPVAPITQDAIYDGTTITQFGVVNGKMTKVKPTTTASTAKITKGMTSSAFLFQNCKSLTSIDTTDWNTGDITDMGAMFYGCELLTTLNVSNFNTSKLTKMNTIFRGCQQLTILELSKWNTSNATDMTFMFDNCKKLTTAGAIDKWDVSKVTSHIGFNQDSPLQPLPIWVN